MRTRLLAACLLAMAIICMALTGCPEPAPTPVIINSPTPPAPAPKPTADTPAFKESEVIGVAGNQPEVKSLYAAAETTKDYKFPEVKDFKWSAQYIGAGQWYVSLAYTQWDYNVNGYVARIKGWYFDEATGTLRPAG